MKTNFEILCEVFSNNSYEIFQFLGRDEINKLKQVHPYFCNLCDCSELFESSIEQLDELFTNEIETESKNNKKIVINCDFHNKKKSKFLEKFNFNKPIEKFYKNTSIYNKRIQSATKRKFIGK